MPDREDVQAFAGCLRAAVAQGCAELAESLGGTVDAQVGKASPLDAPHLAPYHGAGCLLIGGSFGGAATGPIAVVLRPDAACRLADRARQADGDETRALTEEDTAAVVFVLAGIGEAGCAAWEGMLAAAVSWPSDPSAWTPGLVDTSGGLEPVAEALGAGDDLLAFPVSASDPLGVELLFVAPAELAAAVGRLARSASGRPTAESAQTPTDGPDDPPADAPAAPRAAVGRLARLLPVTVLARVAIAQRRVTLRQLLELTPGRVLDLRKCPGEPMELHAGEKLLARGEAVTVDDRFGFRVSELVSDDHATRRHSRLV